MKLIGCRWWEQQKHRPIPRQSRASSTPIALHIPTSPKSCPADPPCQLATPYADLHVSVVHSECAVHVLIARTEKSMIRNSEMKQSLRLLSTSNSAAVGDFYPSALSRLTFRPGGVVLSFSWQKMIPTQLCSTSETCRT